MLKEKISVRYSELLDSNKYTQLTSKLIELSRHQENKNAKALLYELTRLTIHKEYNQKKFIQICETINKENSDFIQKYLTETFWLIGLGLEKSQFYKKNNEEYEKEYSSTVNCMIEKKILNKMKLMEKLEEHSLFTCGFIADTKNFNTKTVRANTNLIYVQQKYNLLREASEGYSKLIFLLTQMTEKSTKTEILIKKILSLIGFFDLDPNRVLDIVLTAFENDYRNLNYIQIIKIFPQHSFPHILGFKFQNQFSTEMNTDISQLYNEPSCNGEINNYKLFLVTAQLIKHGFLILEDILPHLSTDEKMEEFYLDKINLSVSIYKYYTQMRLNKDVIITEVKAKEKEKEDLNELKKQDLKNQKFILLSALIRVNSFYHCEILYNLYSNFYDPLAHPFLTKSLCDICHWIIEPAFRAISYNKSFNNYKSNENEENDFYCSTSNGLNQINDPKLIISELNKIFKLLSVGLSADIVLFTKICRLIKFHSKALLSDEANIELLSETIMKIFLPSLSLIEDCPPGLVNDLWLLLSEFDYCKRYYFYNYWMNYAYRLHPRLYVQHSIVTKETNKWLKTLEKETYRQNGRKLGVLTNSNPCIVFDIAIRIVLSYDNQIPIFISTLSYCSNLSYDVISFVLLKLLSDPSREKLDINNADISYFLINIANFVGLFYKKQHLVEFSGLIYFLANKLRNNSTIELLVFKELISKMSGWPTLEDLNENQLNSFAGGVNLIYEAMNISSEIKNLKKSNQSLLNFFFKVSNIAQKNLFSSEHSLTNGNLNNFIEKENLSLAFVIMILLGEKRNSILYKTDIKQLKLLGSLYDKCQYVFVQFGDYISNNSDINSYSQLIPDLPFSKYPLYYKASPEVVFFIMRPCIKPLYELSETEYLNYITEFSTTLDSYMAIHKENEQKSYISNYLEEDKLIEDIYKQVWSYIKPELYFIFWSLRLKDIYFPSQRYESEIDKINKEIAKLTDELKNGTSESQSKVKKEIEKMKNSIENLKIEMTNLLKHNENIVKFIESKKNTLLDNIKSPNKRELSRYLIQYCLFPRMIFSKSDALFAAKMLILLVKLEIKSLNILDMLSKIIKIIIPCIICVTEYEAQNIGIFLNEFLRTVSNWLEEKVWEKECKNNSCFSRNLDSSTINNSVNLIDFKKVNNFLLSKKTNFFEIFQAKEYMSCRNALIVLHLISNVYPISKENAKDLLKVILEAKEKLSDYNDLCTMAKRYTDNLTQKIENLPSELDVAINDNKEKKNGDKSKKKHSKEKKEGKDNKKKEHKEDSSKTPEIKKRPSPSSLEDFKRRKKDN